jgi:hypothetical protein
MHVCMCACVPQRPFEALHLLLFLIRVPHMLVFEYHFFFVQWNERIPHSTLLASQYLRVWYLFPGGRDVVFFFTYEKQTASIPWEAASHSTS